MAVPGGRLRIVLLAAALAALAGGLALWYFTQPRQLALPSFPGIENEDFGFGIPLGAPAAAAENSKLPGKTELWLITREELTQRDPYGARQPERDLLVVLHSADSGTDNIVELRAYLASEKSAATLGGKSIADLTPERLQEIYGAPYDYSSDASGRIHLTYHFAVEGEHEWSWRLTTSHEFDGRPFALALAKVYSIPVE